MPELPEVESTRRALAQACLGACVKEVVVRETLLRWPLPESFSQRISCTVLEEVTRRGKYLVFRFSDVHLLVHLGMSGSFTIVDETTVVKKHDHIDIVFHSGIVARYHDPRRFGSFHLIPLGSPVEEHPLLRLLGPEPLSSDFHAEYLHEQAQRTKSVAIKPFLMNSRVVVGVGNIYASEALFRAGVHPARLACEVGKASCLQLVVAVKEVLGRAIEHGGTTLRDYRHGAGQKGEYRECLQVYEREGQGCTTCGELIEKIVLGQRSSYFCPGCQQ
jgi:formamidopyrimidine-DNA glycosylase